ncbi:hypothetical protein AVEN_233094-1 [Araneus ventricosus]|uniref:Uncharacterized protein n=1 Tax=Araneus ventricosus TaxID=182803 RepID=A0A4Y2WMR5_ARAVE|nr:hypothetical protein AVEN_233094-1 [Araneus ventricosus]
MIENLLDLRVILEWVTKITLSSTWKEGVCWPESVFECDIEESETVPCDIPYSQRDFAFGQDQGARAYSSDLVPCDFFLGSRICLKDHDSQVPKKCSDEGTGGGGKKEARDPYLNV